MKFAQTLGGGAALVRTFKIGATVISGQAVIWDTSNKYGEICSASTTGAADAFGVTIGAGTYAAATEATVEVCFDPFAVFELPVAGGATAGTALATTAPSNILTQTSASTTVISAAEVGTVTFAGGIIIGLSGANKDASRTITSHSNSTSTTVTVAFANSVAVGDKLIRFPFGPGSQVVQLTSDLAQANGIIVAGTGAPMQVVKVTADTKNESAPTASVFATFRDHFLNPLS